MYLAILLALFTHAKMCSLNPASQVTRTSRSHWLSTLEHLSASRFYCIQLGYQYSGYKKSKTRCSQAPFTSIWSWVPKTTLSLCNPGRVNFSLNCPQVVSGVRQLGWKSCLPLAGRVTLTDGTTFLHVNTLAHLTGTYSHLLITIKSSTKFMYS